MNIISIYSMQLIWIQLGRPSFHPPLPDAPYLSCLFLPVVLVPLLQAAITVSVGFLLFLLIEAI